MKKMRLFTSGNILFTDRQRENMINVISARLRVLMALAFFSILFTFRTQPAYAADYGTYDHSQDAALVAKMADLNNINGTAFVMDLSENNVPVKQVYTIFQHLLNENPEIFYLKFNSKTCQIEQAKKCVTKITVQLDDNRQGIEKKVENFNAVVKNIIESADFDRMSTVETVIYLHNYLVENVEYCGERADYKTAYGALIDGQATCTGYVLAFNHLLKQFDIPCGYVVSEATIHAWNVVNVYNKWYHIDVCWDDTASTQKQSYTYLFLDENELLALEPSRKDMDIQMEDYTYENKGRQISASVGREFWNLTDTDVVYVQGSWYYTTTESKSTHSIMRYDADTEKTENVAADTGVWNAWGSKSYYRKNYTHLATDGKDLYYSTANTICKYNPTDGKTSVYALPSTSTGYIYNLAVKDDAVWYALGKSYNEIGELQKAKQVNVEPSQTTLSKVTAGSKNFTAAWKKQTRQTTGYELQYSTKKSFSKAQSVDVTSNKTVKITASNLTAGKTYYVRIRTYNTVNGNKYYSDWSEVKRVKTGK